MFHREEWLYRAVGFAVVVHSPSEGLVAYGGGHPPSWCKTAAAAEAWALHIILSMSVMPPNVRTDCMALLSTA